MSKAEEKRMAVKRSYLISRRHELNITQYRVADRIGMEVTTYNQIENGKLGNLMNAYWLEKLAYALELPVDVVVRLESKYYVDYCKVNNLHRYYLD